MLQLLDLIFTLAHVVIIAFNLLGWIWYKTRRLHLLCVLLTALSWFLLGIWYGFGYCFLTDWQWQIKRRLGETDLPASFIKYAADQVTGFNTDPILIDWITVVSFGAVAVLSITLNIRDKRRKQAAS